MIRPPNDVNAPEPVIDTLRGSVSLIAPTSAQVQLHDVAGALALLPRYNGHTWRRWTVGQHSLLCADIMDGMLDAAEDAGIQPTSPETRAAKVLFALWHDAAEAYVGDISRPLKRLLGEVYAAIERPVQRACYAALVGAQPGADEAGEKHIYDNLSLRVEAEHLIAAQWAGHIECTKPLHDYATARFLDILVWPASVVFDTLCERHAAARTILTEGE